MKTEDFVRVMRSPVVGVTGDDLAQEISYVLNVRRELMPLDTQEELTNITPETMQTIVHLAAFAAQCRLRRAHRLPSPLVQGN